MSLPKKIIDVIMLLCITAIAVIVFSTCNPAIGTPWYPRSAASSSTNFIIARIQVKGLDVIPVLAETPKDSTDKIKKFSEAKTYTVNVPPNMAEIAAEDIKVTAISSLARAEAVPVEVTVNGDSVPLSAGQVVPVTVKIADAAGNYTVQEKILSITQSEPYDLNLTSLNVLDKELFVDGTLQGSITVPYTVSTISSKDITAKFTYGAHTTVIPVHLGKPSIKLYQNESTELTLSVKEQKGQYHAFDCTITITREAKPENADPVLELDSLFILGFRYENGKTLEVPVDTEQITENDVIASFKDFGDLPVTMTPSPAVFGSNDLIELKLVIPAQAGKYEAWDTSITIKKDPTALNNPQDKHGNKKYITKVKTITEEVSPFDYYKQDYEFPAAKFDNWVLVMPSMSGIISTYKFQDGNWTGSPDSIDNIPSSIGAGFKAISNVKIYRYKTRAARWSAHGGYVPAGDPHDSRFYFYRFTANASGGIQPDSSLFCVDRYSKFLFYYSEPAEIRWIAGNAVPEKWTDYAAPTEKDHTHFAKPFYMSDPVGYVKADGSVVIYSWLKDNINKAHYHAQQNTAYTKKAGRSPGEAGYSPYRDKILTKRSEVETTVNTAYTVAAPVILGQPKAVRVQLNAADEAAFTVKTAPAPKDEQLSYQWYTNTTQSTEGGTPIADATGATYMPNKSVEIDCYVYCAVTNTNSENAAAETVKSNAVKLLIRNGSLDVDADQPKIVIQPAGKIFSTSAPENERKMELKVTAVSPDKGKLSYQWYKKSANSTSTGEAINGATEATYSFTVDPIIGTEYYYCEITNTNNAVDGKKTASICTDPALIVVEASYKVFFDTAGEGSITAIHIKELKHLEADGSTTIKYEQKLIETGAYIKKGETVRFLAQANDGHEVLQWEGTGLEIAENKLSATLTVTEQKIVKVVFRKIPDTRKLTITAKKLENINLDCYGWSDRSYAYFVYNFKAQIFDTAEGYDDNNYQSLWSIYNGEDTTNAFTPVSKICKLAKGESITSSNSTTKEFSKLPDTQFFRLDTKLAKYDHNFANTTVDKQYLSGYNQSVVEFVYDKEKDEWKCKKANIENNFVIKNVTPSFDETFVLKRGQPKDFTISYYVDNAGNYAVGTVEVTYTLKWE